MWVCLSQIKVPAPRASTSCQEGGRSLLASAWPHLHASWRLAPLGRPFPENHSSALLPLVEWSYTRGQLVSLVSSQPYCLPFVCLL